MAILKRKSQATGKTRYQVIVDKRDATTGARNRTVVGTYATKKEAEAAEREALTKRDRGTLLDPSTTTIGELLDAWLAAKTGEITDNTLADYELAIRKHVKPALGSIRVQELRADRLQAQYAAWREQGTGVRTIQRSHIVLSQALDYATRVNLVHANICKDVKPPRSETRKPDVWNADEARRFLDAAEKDSLSPLWHLLLLEGMRKGEALGLRWRDINFERSTAHIVQNVVADKRNKGAAKIQERTKTKAGARTVRLTEATLSALKTHKKQQAARRLAATDWQDNDLVICTATGTPINSGGNVTRALNAIIKRTGLRHITVHDLRHTCATLLFLDGEAAKVVSERLGHANIAITLDIYSHVLPDMQERAAARLDRIFQQTGS